MNYKKFQWNFATLPGLFTKNRVYQIVSIRFNKTDLYDEDDDIETEDGDYSKTEGWINFVNDSGQTDSIPFNLITPSKRFHFIPRKTPETKLEEEIEILEDIGYRQG